MATTKKIKKKKDNHQKKKQSKQKEARQTSIKSYSPSFCPGMSALLCICGEHLMVTVAAIYGVNNISVYCNKCSKDCTNGLIYHCPMNMIAEHQHGYDLCDLCYLNSNNHSTLVTKYIAAKLEVNQDLLQSTSLKRLKQYLNAYHMNGNTQATVSDLQQIVNDYIDVQHRIIHDDNLFEFVCHYLGHHCDIHHCEIQRRRNSNANTAPQNDEELNDIVIKQIMENMHCFFLHSFDVGYRHSAIEKQAANSNQTCIQLTHRKRQNMDDQLLYPHRSAKFKCKTLSIQDDTSPMVYEFGTSFKYTLTKEEQRCMKRMKYKQPTHSVVVAPKYMTLKEELTSNTLTTIKIRRFNRELHKASTYLNSCFCKSNFPSISLGRKSKYHLTKEHVLAIQCYCNCDHLQHVFSETYRENIEKHTEFYFLGKYSKLTVHCFGSNLRNSPIRKLYHGVNQHLLFPCVSGGIVKRRRDGIDRNVSVQCPLSTSCVLQVAISFTNNRGIVAVVSARTNKIKTFGTHWLSDYPEEQEYLALQMPSNMSFPIHNIIEYTMDLATGSKTTNDHKKIMETFALIDRSFRWNKPSFNGNTEQKRMIEAMLYDQLSQQRKEYHADLSSTKYVKDMCDRFFKRPTTIRLTYQVLMQHTPGVYNIFIDSEHIVNLDLIHVLFPNVRIIKLNSSLTNGKYGLKISLTDTITRHKTMFEQTGLCLQLGQKKNTIRIEHQSISA
eukprot:236268_1